MAFLIRIRTLHGLQSFVPLPWSKRSRTGDDHRERAR